MLDFEVVKNSHFKKNKGRERLEKRWKRKMEKKSGEDSKQERRMKRKQRETEEKKPKIDVPAGHSQ